MGDTKGNEGRTGKVRPVVRRRPNKAGEQRRPVAGSGSRDAVVYLDAEDIAMARLQASLRRAEAIQTATPAAASGLGRTTVRLSMDLLSRTRNRAARDGATVSEIVTRALERFLRGR